MLIKLLKYLKFFIFIVCLLALGLVLQAQENEEDTLIIDDFEIEVLFLGEDSDGLDIGYAPWGDRSGNAVLELVEAEDDLALPEQSDDNQVLKVSYDINGWGGFTHALTDGEEWVSQDWTDYNTLDFWLYGANSEAMIQVEIFDNRAPDSRSDTAERWYYRVEDNFTGWQFFSIPFSEFQRRTDWQPGGAPRDGLGLDEVHGYAFSFPAGVGAYVNYIDNVGLSKGEGNVILANTSTDEEETDSTSTVTTEPIDYNFDGEWELIWDDEFDADAGEPINADYWTCEVGGHGWGNEQLEHNTDRTDNVAHDGEGHLVITAREESFDGNDYTSGRCNTMDKFEFTYGKVEARINLPEGQGIWPAFWMLGANFPEVGWPDSGEIDIMEYVGKEPLATYGTVHGPGYSGATGVGMQFTHEEPVADDFHVFGIEWEPNIIRWTVDGEIFHTLTPEMLYGETWVFDHDFFLIINVAVGGLWPGSPDDTTQFPQEMVLDWVRVYQRVD